MEYENDSDVRECPFCAEIIKKKAKICRYCKSEIAQETHEKIQIDTPKAVDDRHNSANESITEEQKKVTDSVLMVIGPKDIKRPNNIKENNDISYLKEDPIADFKRLRGYPYKIFSIINDVIKIINQNAVEGHTNSQYCMGLIYLNIYAWGKFFDQDIIDRDPIFDKIIDFLLFNEKCNAGILQNQFGLDFNRAEKIISILVSDGFVNKDDTNNPAKEFKIDIKTYVRIKEEDAFKWFMLAAEKEHVEAQYSLGWCYENGCGVKQNYKDAFQWYEKAAAKGHSSAQFNVGWFYENGYGIEQNYEKAFEWYKLSANQENAYASVYIGRLYENGFGVDKSDKDALKFYDAASKNIQLGNYYLGRCYEKGIGVEKNYNQAIYLYGIHGDKYDLHYENSLAVHGYLCAAKLSSSWKESFVFYLGAAEKGHLDAQIICGWLYENGLSYIDQNSQTMRDWLYQNGIVYLDKDQYLGAFLCYKKAADQDNALAKHRIGLLYEKGGCGIKQDYAEAFKWYKLASEQGNSSALWKLGMCYLNGIGTNADCLSAVECFIKSAEKGNSYGMNSLGNMFYRGDGVAQDYKEAFKWFNLSAIEGNPYAQNNLGLCYKNGQGVAQDFKRAFQCFKVAADKGSDDAKLNLGWCYEKGKGVKKNLEWAEHYYKEDKNEWKKYFFRRLPKKIIFSVLLFSITFVLVWSFSLFGFYESNRIFLSFLFSGSAFSFSIYFLIISHYRKILNYRGHKKPADIIPKKEPGKLPVVIELYNDDGSF